MSGSEESLDTSSGTEENPSSSGSPPSPENSNSDGNEASPLAVNLDDNSTADAPSPTSTPISNSSPPPDSSSSNEQSTSPPPPPPSEAEGQPPETSASPPALEKNDPPPANIQPPSSPKSTQESSDSSSSSSPSLSSTPSTPSQQESSQSPPSSPSPSKQNSPQPPSSPGESSSQPSPEKSTPNPSPSNLPSPSPPSPSSSNETSESTNSTSPPSSAFAPPSLNGSSSSPPQALTPPVATPPKSAASSSSSSGSSKSGGSNSNSQNNAVDVKKTNIQVVIGVTVAVVFIIALIAIFFFVRKRKKRRSNPYPNYTPPPLHFSVTSGPYMGHSIQTDAAASYYNSQHQAQQSNTISSFGSQRAQNYHGPDSGIIAGSKTFFSYEELMEMTHGFSRMNVIGEGGFGCVYKGWTQDGRPVAVKQLKAGSGQGEREFRAEVEIISRVHHRHLVSLVGYSVAENQRLLIYEFVPNKTLEHHLHSNNQAVLEWDKRVKIAVGAAKGLAYLHEDCHPKIIHRDIKSANILLEEDFTAQVADFGLARLNDTTQTHVSTRVMGTFGYLAPEYASSGKLTDRSDVYSFGVVLLELITGRKPVDSTQPLGDESLVEWARPLLIQALETGDISELIDPRLQKRYVEREVLRMIEAAAACVRHSAARRPRMAVVVRALDFEEDSDLSNGVKFGQSTAYDSAQYDKEIMKFRRMALGSDVSSEIDMYSGEYKSREVSGTHPNSWKYSSDEYTSGELETKAFKPDSGEHSGAARNYGGGRFR